MDRVPTLFTNPESWMNGFYELAIELGPRSDERLTKALEFIWGLKSVEGPYRWWDIDPAEQSVVLVMEEGEEYGALRGLADIPGATRAPCGTFVVREDEGTDWLGFYLPMGALETVCDVGFFPFGSGSGSRSWREPLDAWLAELGAELYSRVPFALALIGHEMSGSTTAAELRDRGVPDVRHAGYLTPEAGVLRWFPATVYS